MVLEYFCPICQEEYLASDEIFITRCGHVFHQKCLHDWFVTQYTCPDCRTPCTRTDSFKVFIKSRESEFVGEMMRLMDANEVTMFELQLKLSEANQPQQTTQQDLELKSNLQKQENEQLCKELESNTSNISKEVAEKDKIIKQLETKLCEKSLELEKEIRKSTLMIVEKMKLQQQLYEAKRMGIEGLHTAQTGVAAKTADMKNLNIQLNKSNSKATSESRTPAEPKKPNAAGGVVNKRPVGNAGSRLNDAQYELFKYTRRLNRVGYRFIFHQDNVIYVRKNNFAPNCKIETKEQVDELMRKSITSNANGVRDEVPCDDQFYAI